MEMTRHPLQIVDEKQYVLFMVPIRTQGIILQAITFREADQILTIITPEGLIKLAYKGALSGKRGRGALTAPLQAAEFVYIKHQGEIGSCREISILNPLMTLRQKLEFLESAGEMAAVLLKALQPEATSPLLYRLFLQYLENLPLVKDPYLLAASFKLKILRHEGILLLQETCSVCERRLENMWIWRGECFCAEHAPGAAIPFSSVEQQLLLECTYGRSMKIMAELQGTPPLYVKVQRLFKSCYEEL